MKQTAFFIDVNKWDKDNKNNKNYWDIYFEQIMIEAGVSADKITDFDNISQYEYLFIGDCDVSENESKLKRWVENGGVLICSLTEGINDLIGIKSYNRIIQPDSFYTISANFKFPDSEDRFIKIKDTNASLPVISDYAICDFEKDVNVLANLYEGSIGGIWGWADLNKPALISRQVKKGMVYYFVFSITQTMWVMHKGRPVDRDWDGDGYYRTGDAIVFTPAHNLKVPHADIYLYCITKMLDNVPMIHQLPPDKDNKITDMIIHFGGDDEGDKDYQINAAKKMKERNLPYHVNLMLRGGRFAVNKEEFDNLIKDGCEPSIHFDFYKVHTHFTKEELNYQLDLYEKEFNSTPVVSVNHVMMYTGWAEFPRWCAQRGIMGDNSKAHVHLMPSYNPINELGFGFGTTYPQFVYDDSEHNNRRLNFVELPIVFYEPRCKDEKDKEFLHRSVDSAVYYNWTMNMFLHPVYIDTDENALKAVEEAVDYINKKGYVCRYMGNDELCKWWFKRRQSSIYDFKREEYGVSFKVICKNEQGCVVKVKYNSVNWKIDEIDKAGQIKKVCGEEFSMNYIPFGEHEVKIYEKQS